MKSSQILQNRKLRILYVTSNQGFCNFYRLKWPSEELVKQGYAEVMFTDPSLTKEVLELATWADVIVFQYALVPELIIKMCQFVKENRIPQIICVEFDDNYFHVHPINAACYMRFGTEEVFIPSPKNQEDKWYFKDGEHFAGLYFEEDDPEGVFDIKKNKERLKGLERVLSAVDVITTTTPQLAETYAKYNDVAILPNCINPSVMPIVDHSKDKDKRIIIGWQGGDCVDSETEILTDNGWKFINQLNKTEKVATLNKSNKIEYNQPYEYIEKDYDGYVYICENKKVNYFVTENHKMLCSENNNLSKKIDNYSLVTHKSLNNKTFHLKRDGIWQGKEIEFFTVPNTDITFKMDDWLTFFGFWLAEGWTTKKLKQVGVAQKKNNNYLSIMFNILENVGLKPYYTKDRSQLRIFGDSLYNYLKELGKAHNKYIPKTFKLLSKRQINILLTWYINGDGCVSGNRIRTYTVSKQLADDVQELALKARFGASIVVRDRKIKNWRPCYVVSIYDSAKYTKAYKPLVKQDDYSRERFIGKVYCVSVKNHVWYMRRNGKTMWTGNSHFADLRMVFPALEKIKKEYGNKVHFVFWGAAFLNLIEKVKGEFIPWTRPNLFYENFAKKKIDIGIIPVIRDKFNYGKSAIKWMENSYYGIPSVVANEHPYKTHVKHDKTAMVYNNNDQAYHWLKMLIDDKMLRLIIGKNAQARVMQHYTIKENAHMWYTAYLAALDKKILSYENLQ